MADVTARFGLDLIEAGQAQKEVTHNAAIDRIDALLQMAVVSRTLAAPPAAPDMGAAWIVAALATGDWTGREGMLATMAEGGWIYTPPREGCLAWIADEQVFAVHRGGAWDGDAWPVAALRINGRRLFAAEPVTIVDPSGGVTVDSEARSAIAQLLASLRLLGLVSD